jgi:hypothetical protein
MVNTLGAGVVAVGVSVGTLVSLTGLAVVEPPLHATIDVMINPTHNAGNRLLIPSP